MDLKRDTKNVKDNEALGLSDSDVSDFEDQIDNMEEDDMLFDNEKKGAKAVGKRNAIDRTDDTEIDHLQERDDEADETVFIDNLPKDEASLKQMIKEVNGHIRVLER